MPPLPGFDLPEGWDQPILFGPGRAHELGDELARIGCTRPIVLCSWRRRRSEDFGHIAGGIGVTPRVFEGVEAHVPSGLVEQAWRTVDVSEADGLISFGGGSAIDLGKAVLERAAREAVSLIHVAVPTTYSGTAATTRFWVTQADRPSIGQDRRIRPDLAVLDPGLTVALPWKPTAATAVTAVAHCWGASIVPGKHHPLAERAAGTVMRALPVALERPDDGGARAELLGASYAAGVVHDLAGTGLHDALCHGLGSRAGVPHGLANAILLPSSIRAAADRGVVGEQEEVAEFVRGLGLPRRLREAGVFEQDLEPIAEWAAEHRGEAAVRTEALGILRDAW